MFNSGQGLLLNSLGRSATIVTAYLMYSRNADVNTALDMVRKVRPNVE